MTGLAEVGNAIRVWSAEADSGAPVTDSEIALRAETGDLDGVRDGLRVNAQWRTALRVGNREAMAAVLAHAARFTEPVR